MTTDNSLTELDEQTDYSSAPKAARRATKEGDEISLLDILIILAQRKRIVFRVTAVFAVLAIVISLLLPKSYTATITLLPPQQSTSMGAVLASQLESLGGMAASTGGSLGINNLSDRYVAMFKSRTVEDAMVEHFSLMQEYHARYLSDARGTFEAHAMVEGSDKDGLIHISVMDRDPRRAEELANGYVDQFRTQSQHLAFTEASQRRLFFERELEQAKNNLANAEEALKQTELTTGVIQLDSQARSLIELAASLRGQIIAREVQIQGMQTYATPENDQLVQAQRELQGLRAQLAKVGGSENNPDGDPTISEGRVPGASLEYIRKLRDVKYNETIFDILARQFEAAKLDEAKQGPLIQVVDPAVTPDRKSSPKRALIVLVATVCGFIMGILAAFLAKALENARNDPEEHARLTKLKAILFGKPSVRA